MPTPSSEQSALGGRRAAKGKTVGNHWPKGKARNDPGISKRELDSLLLDLRQLTEPTRSRSTNRGPSLRGCAAYIGVDTKTVRNWLTGANPRAEHVELLKRWLRQKQSQD